MNFKRLLMNIILIGHIQTYGYTSDFVWHASVLYPSMTNSTLYPMDSPHKGLETRKIYSCHSVILDILYKTMMTQFTALYVSPRALFPLANTVIERELNEKRADVVRKCGNHGLIYSKKIELRFKLMCVTRPSELFLSYVWYFVCKS